MMRFIKPILVSAIIVLAFSGCQTNRDARPPNVIYIFPDQYRNYSLGFWSEGDNARHIQGNPDPVFTPALDELAREGVVFSRAVSNFPLCSPYRGMFLTGMYPDQNGITTNCRNDRDAQLKTDAICITDVFAAANYNVSYFGKCHWQKNEALFDEHGTYQGTTDPPGGYEINRYDTYVPPGPDRHSIDYFFQALKDDHFNPRVYSNDPLAIEGKQDGELYLPGRFSSEIESEKIIDYLGNTHGQRDPDKPFFLIWSLNPPHNPWTEDHTYMEFFDQYTESGKINYEKLLRRDNADSLIGDYAPYYFTNVSAVDYFIGKVLDQLEELGLADNTIIVFTSDHGEMLGSHKMTGKNNPEIEALNIPFIIKWGNKLGHRVEDLMLSVPDIMPTLLSLAGLEQEIPPGVQGSNYSSILSNPDAASVKKPGSALYIGPNSRGVYTGKYTFIVGEDARGAAKAYCYDNVSDPYQMKRIDYAQLDKKTGSKLKGELATLLKSTNDKWYRDKVLDEFFSY